MLYQQVLKKISILKSNSQFREIFVNTIWLFADKILRMGVGLIVIVWVARYLGVQKYGNLNYSLAFVALFSPFVTLGLDNIVIRYIIREPSNRERILGTTFWLKLLGGTISLVLAIGCILLFRPDDKLTIALVSILSTVGFFQAFDTIDLWFQSQVQSKYTVVAKNTAFILITLLQVTLIAFHAPLIAFAWVKVAEFMMGAVGLLISYKFTGYSISSWRWSFPLAKILLSKSWYLILAGVGTMIYMRIDQIMLGEMVGNKAVGIYSAATRISEVWYFIPMAISSSVMPSIFRAKEISETLYHQRLKKTISLLFILSLIVALPMTFLSSSLVTMLFGNDYIEAGQILSIHIWASVFISLGIGASPWFIAENYTHLALKITLTGAIINIILNLFLIPHYGCMGAAIATVISQIFASFLAHAIYPETRKLFLIQIMSLTLPSKS
jgi:polysaccharide transporter, PST family